MKKQIPSPAPNLSGDAPSASLSLPQAAPEGAALRRSPGKRSTGPFANSGSPETDQTEVLLQGLIAECHAIIREQVRPAVDADEKAIDKLYMVRAAMELAKTGARIAETIGHLRGGQPAPEMRQRITVERIQTLPEKP